MADGQRGAMIGGAVGTAFGPLGTVAGGAIGKAISGLFGKKDKKKLPKPPPPPKPWYVEHRGTLIVGSIVVGGGLFIVLPAVHMLTRKR